MRQIENYNYWIDEYGNVYNKKKYKLKPSISNKGYYMHKLFISKGNRKWIYPHRYVALYWCDNPNNKPQVNHIDGNPKNNSYTNLEWVTGSENQIHRSIILRRGVGENTGAAKIKEQDVIWIKNNCVPKDKKFGLKPLSKKFNISYGQIRRIYYGERWKYLNQG